MDLNTQIPYMSVEKKNRFNEIYAIDVYLNEPKKRWDLKASMKPTEKADPRPVNNWELPLVGHVVQGIPDTKDVTRADSYAERIMASLLA